MLFCLAAQRSSALTLGIFAGFLMLLNPALLFVAVPWMAYALWRRHVPSRARFAAVAVLLPWTLRNYRQFHALFFVRDNMGLELRLANNSLAEPDFRGNIFARLYQQLHAGGSLREAQSMRNLGEEEYNRRQFRAAVLWTRTHPARFLSLTAARIRMF